MKKNNCTETCKGIIKEIKIKGIDFPSEIIVEFEIGGKKYEIFMKARRKSSRF